MLLFIVCLREWLAVPVRIEKIRANVVLEGTVFFIEIKIVIFDGGGIIFSSEVGEFFEYFLCGCVEFSHRIALDEEPFIFLF